MGRIILNDGEVKILDDNEGIGKEIIFNLSVYLDICIKEAAYPCKDTDDIEMNLKVLYDILNTLNYLEKIETEEDTTRVNTQPPRENTQ
jgi:hypothetical protein